jgi:uncharacterized membrane protein
VREGAARAAVAVLSLAGAGIAAYLTYAHYRGVVPVCTVGGCETVLTSEYAELAGVPVAALGLAAYVALLVTAFLPSVEAAAAGLAIALGGLGFALYLVYVQLVVLDAVCVWCMASDVVMVLVTLAAGLRLWAATRDGAAAATHEADAAAGRDGGAAGSDAA